MTHQELKILAEQHGFCDIALVSMQPFEEWRQRVKDSPYPEREIYADPRLYYPQASCLCVLYKAYSFLPLDSKPYYSRYYIASNQAYFSAKAFAAELQQRGFFAQPDTRLPVREAAFRAGGIRGENGFYISPKWGIGCYLTIVATDAAQPEADGEVSACLSCGACQKACPSGAMTAQGMRVERCLRYLIETSTLSEEQRTKWDSLIGCDLCQRACPLGKVQIQQPSTEERMAMSYEAFVNGDKKRLAPWIGKNFAKPIQNIKTALLCIGNDQKTEYFADVERLCEAQDETTKEYALWARGRLVDKDAE